MTLGKSLITMRSDHYTAAPIPDAQQDDITDYVDVAIIGGGPGGLSAGVAVSIADPSLSVRVSTLFFQAKYKNSAISAWHCPVLTSVHT